MTYSIVARDPTTSELGIAVQSRYFAAGRVVPWIEAGVGAIASQAFASPVYGHEGLRLLRLGLAPDAALDKLLSEDAGLAQRQVGMIDAQGRIAVHTGENCVAAAGHAIGTHCSAQAIMMARDTVWHSMVRAFESAPGDLADRLVAAMEAGSSFAARWCCSLWGASRRDALPCSGPIAFTLDRASCCFASRMPE
jgi:uncharacterized Ntn-hydrolase superfamily protein